MRCPQCGFEGQDSGKFCSECGASLVLVCSACGTASTPGSKFCKECGQRLAAIGTPGRPLPGSTSPTPSLAGSPASYAERIRIRDDRFASPQSYTPKPLAEKILSSRSAIEGERKQVTVMFTDVSGFTAMSSRLDPEDVHEIMEDTGTNLAGVDPTYGTLVGAADVRRGGFVVGW